MIRLRHGEIYVLMKQQIIFQKKINNILQNFEKIQKNETNTQCDLTNQPINPKIQAVTPDLLNIKPKRIIATINLIKY